MKNGQLSYSISASLPIRVGLVGTGYAAKVRAEALRADPRAKLVAIAGHNPDKTTEFSQTFSAQPVHAWEDLVRHPDLDLIIIATINRDHGAIAHAALEAGKHVVVEYPLSLDVQEADTLIALAATQEKLLHVEHIELLSGIHQALVEALPEIGAAFYVRYVNLNPQNPAPPKWTYQSELFGFPLIGALSRIHRLIDLFGQVTTVSCDARFWNTSTSGTYSSCLCSAQLRFSSGLLADVVYGKGEALWKADRTLEVHGEKGAVLFDGEAGTLVQANESRPLDVGSRRGLFAKDTAAVLEALTKGAPLYVTPAASLYALKVADAARRSAETGQIIRL